MKKGYLVLQDGQVFEGIRFGAETDTVGELVFSTGVVGYVEALTDPAYAGQILMQTYPLIGNVGVIREDIQGACCVKGYVAREFCDAPSNFRTDCDLETYLKEEGVPGLYGVDTRQLTRIIRENGVMNAMICDEVPADRSGGRSDLQGSCCLPRCGRGEGKRLPDRLRRGPPRHQGSAGSWLQGDGRACRNLC